MPLMARYLDDLEAQLHGARRARRALRDAVLRRHRDAGDGQARADPPRGVRARGGRAGRRARGARASATGRLLSFDMGGTTAKACVIDGGEPLVAREFEVARADRFKKGSGLPIRVPVIEMIEIGAGGGSIARVDRMGLLKVGPDSAGADPGPACYALGGREPTVTDADLLLGYLDPGFFLGGRMRLDVDAAAPRGRGARGPAAGARSVTEAAWGIHRVVNENMAARRAHPRHRARQGPARLPARSRSAAPGPSTRGRWARILRVAARARALRAPAPCRPTGSSPRRSPSTSSAPRRSASTRADWARSTACSPRWRRRAAPCSAGSGVAERGRHASRRTAEMRYVGQGHEVEVRAARGPAGRGSLAAITAAFEAAYRALYSRTPLGVADRGAQLARGRVRARARAHDERGLGAPARAGRPPRRAKGTRRAYFPEAPGYVDTPVYDRYALRAGRGPRGPGHRRGARVHRGDRAGRAGPRRRRRLTLIGAGVMRFPDPAAAVPAEALGHPDRADARQQPSRSPRAARARLSLLDVGCGPGTLTIGDRAARGARARWWGWT